MSPRSEGDPLLSTSSNRERPSTAERTCWRRFRESRRLVLSVVFVAMMLDLIVLTSIDPLLPNIIHRMDEEAYNLSLSQQNDVTTPETPTTTTGPNDWKTNRNDTTDASAGNQTDYNNVESRVGIIIALKPATEVFANIFVGAIVDRFGHMTPMMCGFIFNTASTLGFAYAPSFLYLVAARICQAAASSLSVISGLAMISHTFKLESERSKAISQAFGGLSLGIVLGYPFGSVSYQFIGRRAPFIALAVLSLLDGLFRMLISQPREQRPEQEERKPTAYLKLLKDPCIASALVCNFAPNVALGVFLATGPAWMLESLHAEQWEIGVILTIAMIFQIITQTITGICSPRYGRWKFCLLGMWMYSIALLIYPHCYNVWMVVLPEIFARSGFGMIICVLSPLLSHLVDIRHDSNYGEVFGLYTASYNIALTLGPLLGGFTMGYISFGTLYRSVAALIFIASFLSFVFRNPEPKPVIPGKTVNASRDNRSIDDGSGYFYGSLERSYVDRHQTTWYAEDRPALY